MNFSAASQQAETAAPRAPSRPALHEVQRETLPGLPSISIIVPTYREADNLPALIERIGDVRERYQLDAELLIMDDASGDGTEQVVARSSDGPWVKLVTRQHDFGLSAAVMDGIKRAVGRVIVVMDADLSHPPEKIPEMVSQLVGGSDFVIGSRYVSGGSTDDRWGALRWVNSRVATLMARPFTRAHDPMAGFFALWRGDCLSARELNPVGYKIGLELLVKTQAQRVSEVPIHFADRQKGQSKMTLREQWRYVQHIKRLFDYKFGNWSHLGQFLLVGLSGTVVNLLVLTLMLWLGGAVGVALAGGILISMHWNFYLNRRLSFSYARHEPIPRQYLGFMSSCGIGALVNYLVALGLIALSGELLAAQLAALGGIAMGTGVNFALNRYVVFRKVGASPSAAHG